MLMVWAGQKMAAEVKVAVSATVGIIQAHQSCHGCG